MKKLLSLALGMFLCACAIENNPQINKPKQAQKQIVINKIKGTKIPKNLKNFEGIYMGLENKSIKTIISLKNQNSLGAYEVYKQFPSGKFYHVDSGLAFNAKGGILHNYNYNEGQKFYFEKNKIIFANLTHDEFEKLRVFKDTNEEIYIKEKSIQKGRFDGEKAIKFQAISHKKNAKEYKSSQATYLLYCKSKKYTLSRVAYFDEKFTFGRVLRPVNKLDNVYKISKNDINLIKIHKIYCR